MASPLCIIHANCQGDTLHHLLAATPAFAHAFEIKKYTNYLRDEIPLDDFERCGLFLYQRLGDTWGEHATPALLARLPRQAQALQIPNMFFNGYWPLWTNNTHMAYGDMLLEHLADLGLSASEILRVYLQGKISAMYDFAALMAASRQKEEAKEQGCLIQTLPLIDELWRREQLFYTVNHPGPRLSLLVADGVLRALGLGSVPMEVRRAFRALRDEFEQPLHPQVGRALGLPFATEQRLYAVHGSRMNFAQYAAAYVQCRLQEGKDAVQDFVVYLHLLAEQKDATHAA